MVFKINAKTGAIEGYVDLSPSRMKFLNDLAFINGRLMVSSTDTNQISMWTRIPALMENW